MRLVQLTVLFAVLVASIAQDENNESDILIANDVDRNAVKPTHAAIENKALSVDKVSNDLQKNRRSRYLRQTYRPRRRPPPPFGMKHARRPPAPPSRNRFKPGRVPYPSSKSKYRYQRENWRDKWIEQNQPPSYGPYSALDDEHGIESESPYDEYDDDDTWASYNTKKYRHGYDDVLPVSSRYTEKRSPVVRLMPNLQMLDYQHTRDKTRPYDDYENWLERAKFAKNYRDYVDLLASKTLMDSLNDPYIVGMMANHRFKLANALNTKNSFKYDDDGEYDFSASNDATAGLKNRRYRNVLTNFVRNTANEDRDAKDDAGNLIAGKIGNADIVYSAKYRGAGSTETGKDAADEENKNRNHKDDSVAVGISQNVLPDTKDWKFFQPSMYQAFQSSKSVDYNKVQGRQLTDEKTYKSERLLPNELIAYMSADPSESVIGKEERYLEPPPYSFDILKASKLRKMSPIVDDTLDIIIDERLDNWKH